MGVLNWMRGIDANVAADAALRAQAQRKAASAAENAWGNQRMAEYLTRDAASVAGEAQGYLTRVRPNESPEVAAARDTLLKVLYGDGARPDEFGGDAGRQELAKRMGQLGVGSKIPQESASDALQLLQSAMTDMAQARVNPGAGHRMLADLNSAIATNKLARAGMYSGIGFGGAAGIAALTPAAQELMALTGFLAEGDRTEAKADQPLHS